MFIQQISTYFESLLKFCQSELVLEIITGNRPMGHNSDEKHSLQSMVLKKISAQVSQQNPNAGFQSQLHTTSVILFSEKTILKPRKVYRILKSLAFQFQTVPL